MGIKEQHQRIFKWFIWLALLSFLLIIVSIISISVGSSSISFRRIISAILFEDATTNHSILVNIRIPRVLMGFAVGGALSLSGVLLQGMFRNPLVEPYTLGIPGGAALAICVNIILGLHIRFGVMSFPAFGFIGALVVIVLVYTLSLKKGIIRINGLLLTGVMFSFIASSFIMLIMSISKADDLHGIIFWIMGSLEEANNSIILSMIIVSLAGLLASYFFCRDLNAFALGEEEALHLGINVERTKKLLFLLSSMLIGLSVAAAGIIGFVGLVVPHFMRMIISGDHRILLASSYLAGAAFLILCDTIARTIISPLELPVGVITGILGGSLFIYALSRRGGIVWEKR